MPKRKEAIRNVYKVTNPTIKFEKFNRPMAVLARLHRLKIVKKYGASPRCFVMDSVGGMTTKALIDVSFDPKLITSFSKNQADCELIPGAKLGVKKLAISAKRLYQAAVFNEGGNDGHVLVIHDGQSTGRKTLEDLSAIFTRNKKTIALGVNVSTRTDMSHVDFLCDLRNRAADHGYDIDHAQVFNSYCQGKPIKCEHCKECETTPEDGFCADCKMKKGGTYMQPYWVEFAKR